jgi:hypothetical protein
MALNRPSEGVIPYPFVVLGLSLLADRVEGVATLIVSPAAPPEEELAARLRTTAEAASSGGSHRKAEQFAQTMVVAVLFAVPALICARAACVNDPDVWWHLRTGEWILQHHAMPHTDPFSGPLAGKPWLDYSWLFELTVAKLFQWLGLPGIVSYSAAMVLAITVAMYRLVRRLQGDFTLAVLLSFFATFSMGHLYTPRPWLFTILFFVLELDILMHARTTGKLRELAWLPVIFALWANLHIQFVDGLLVLGLALAEATLARWQNSAQTRVRPVWMGAALLASGLATLLNPYGWHIYNVAYDLATQAGALNAVSELQAMPFRNLSDFLVLTMALGSAAALAWRRRLVSFEAALLVFAAVLSFRSQRDVWLMATAAAAILASAITGREKAEGSSPRVATRLAVALAALAIWAGFHMLQVNDDRLQVQVAGSFPVQAVEAIREGGFSGPLYNEFNWGGYLIWALHMPVSIDGRQNLYGDKRMDRSAATWAAEPDWASDSQLTSAGVVIGPVDAPLMQVLRADPRFQLAYRDKVAAVFVPRR